jgi:hypothetical protein
MRAATSFSMASATDPVPGQQPQHVALASELAAFCSELSIQHAFHSGDPDGHELDMCPHLRVRVPEMGMTTTSITPT